MRIRFTLAVMCLCAGCGESPPLAPVKTEGSADTAPQKDQPAAPGASAASPTQPVAGAIVTEADVARIEDKIGFSLPDAYRKFLLDHAADIANRAASRKKDDYSVLPYATASEIIRNNTGDMDFMVKAGEEEPFADKIVCISDNGGGDYYFIYRDPTIVGVWYWDHETYKVTNDSKDLDEYFSKLGH